LPGDFFGFECVDEHTVSAEAVTNAKVLVIKKTILAAVASRDAAIEHQLLLLMTGELARLQERVFLLLKHAQERVGEFILDMEKRASVGNSIELPMKRQDIADYLGLQIETVSRILTSLENCAAIEIPTRHCIVVRDHLMLKAEVVDRSKPPTIWSCLKKSRNENNQDVDRRRKRIPDPPTNGSSLTRQRLHRNHRAGRVLTKEEGSLERQRGNGESPEVA
jgi:Crp-like helix-turn-helix protein